MTFFGVLVLTLSLIAAGLIITLLGLQAVTVVGRSMEPTLSSGDIVLATTWWPRRLLRRGALVLVRGYGGVEPLPTALMIKRVGNLVGDHVRVRHRGNPEEQELVIERDQVFVLSDAVVSPSRDRDAIAEPEIQTVDSRICGPIPMSSIAGRVVMKLATGARRKI